MLNWIKNCSLLITDRFYDLSTVSHEGFVQFRSF